MGQWLPGPMAGFLPSRGLAIPRGRRGIHGVVACGQIGGLLRGAVIDCLASGVCVNLLLSALQVEVGSDDDDGEQQDDNEKLIHMVLPPLPWSADCKERAVLRRQVPPDSDPGLAYR